MLHIVIGPMYAGKTSRLIHDARNISEPKVLLDFETNDVEKCYKGTLKNHDDVEYDSYDSYKSVKKCRDFCRALPRYCQQSKEREKTTYLRRKKEHILCSFNKRTTNSG